MENFIIIVFILAIIGLAIFYVIRAKKGGKKCIGCPYSCSCDSKNKCNCNSNDI